LAVAERFVQHLVGTGVERGLLGPREVPRIWSRHVLNCAVLAELVPEGVSVLDVGSGAGLPGLALAIARPDLAVTLVEPFARRATWLSEVSADLDVSVRVVRARAEDLAGVETIDVVTARAVAPLERLAGWALPLLVPGGELLAIKGRSAAEEVRAATAQLSRMGAQFVDVSTCGHGVVDPETTVVRVRVGADGYTGPSGKRSRQAGPHRTALPGAKTRRRG
jgi:16S rRNA (guanine527-N7)-methyltransferase